MTALVQGLIITVAGIVISLVLGGITILLEYIFYKNETPEQRERRKELEKSRVLDPSLFDD